MIEKIYIFVMIYKEMFINYYQNEFIQYLESSNISGIKILSCRFMNDPITTQILRNLDQLNDYSIDDSEDVLQTYDCIEFIIESESMLRYQFLPWLNDTIRKFVFLESNIPNGMYFFYLVKNQEKLEFMIACQLRTKKTQLNETTNITEDFSYLNEMAIFLERHIYYYDADETHPDKFAKLLLQCG